MADSTTPIDQVTAGAGAATRVNELADAASPAMLYGRRAATTAGLTWGYFGGRLNSTAVANGTVTLTGSDTNYIVAHRTTGVVSVSTDTTDWDNTTTYMRLYEVVAGASTVTSYEDHRSPPVPATAAVTQCIAVACGDESTAITTGTAKVTFRMPFAMTLTAVRASLTTAQSSGSVLTVDINEGGASILSTKLTIDNGEKTSTTAATPAVISDTALADDAEITVDVDQAGSGGAGLKIYLIGTA